MSLVSVHPLFPGYACYMLNPQQPFSLTWTGHPPSLCRGGRGRGAPSRRSSFAMAIEPLAISVREHAHIKPITLGGVDHNISLYAHGVALFVSDPEHLFQLINSFGEVSSDIINWQKSELITLANDLDPLFLSSTQLKITTEYMKYLGIKISKKPSALFKLNFMEKLNKLKEDIEKWRALPLSLIERVNAIKMVTLPRFLYLFQNIPVFQASRLHSLALCLGVQITEDF